MPACLASITSSLPQRLRWTIWYRGRPLGVVNAHTPSKFRFYAAIGRQIPDAGQAIPKIGKPSEDFSGDEETPVQRPLIATAGPLRLSPSPERWHARVGDVAAFGSWPRNSYASCPGSMTAESMRKASQPRAMAARLASLTSRLPESGRTEAARLLSTSKCAIGCTRTAMGLPIF